MTLFSVGGRAAAVMAALLIGAGCGGEQAFQARPVDGGVGGMTGNAGTGGMDTAGTTGTAGSGGVEMPGSGGTSAGGGASAAGASGTGGTAGTGGGAGSTETGGSGGTTGAGGSGGTTGAGGVAGSGGTGGSGGTAGAGGVAGSGGMGGATGSGGTTAPVILNCPTMIEGALEETDPTQTGRHSRVQPVAACGMAKANPGNSADPANPHLFNLYTFVNPTGFSACFTFTLTYDGTNGLQRYLTAYTTYDPANIGTGYLGDVGAVLTSPQTMAITVPAASSIDVVVVAIDNAPLGVGPYTLRCDTGGGGGGAGGSGVGNSQSPR